MSIRILALAAAALASSGGAAATVLAIPDVVTFQRSVHNVYNSDYSYGAGTISSVHGSASTGGSPYAFASAQAQTGWGYSANYQYYFRVDGAPDDQAIPLIAYVRLAAVAAGSDNASAAANINFNGNNMSVYTNSVDRSLSYNGAVTSSIFSYNLGSVTLEVYTDTQYGGTAWAFADPLIIIDPVYALIDPDYRQHLTLTFSTGVVNAGAVPEPASWAMLVAGFGGVGAVMRRRVASVAV